MCSDKLNYPDQIEQFCIAVVPVGSRVTCNPPPTDTDQDLLCFVKEDDYNDLAEWLEKKGWEYEDCYRLQGDFMSYRKDDWNAIVTYDEKFFDNFIDATKACKSKNLLKKEERIAEFNRVFGVKGEENSPYASTKTQLDFDALINIYNNAAQVNNNA